VGCSRIKLRQLGRKKYPLVRNLPRYEFISNTGFEIESLIVDITNSDTITVIFDKPFTEMPTAVANLVTATELGNVNVYVETVTVNQVVVRTSVPITGKIHIHAMRIQGCDPISSESLLLTAPVAPILLSTNIITQDLIDIVTQNDELLISF